MADDVANGDGEKGFEGLLRHDGGFPQAEPPEREDVEHADEELKPGDKPGEWEPVEDLFVGDVVNDVEGVPEEDVEADLQGTGLLLRGRDGGRDRGRDIRGGGG